MSSFVPLYGLLSVLLRAGILASQSLTVGGIVFNTFVVGPSQRNCAFDKRQLLQWIRRSALVLLCIHFISLLANDWMLMIASSVRLSDTLGGEFSRAGIIAIASALFIAFA